MKLFLRAIVAASMVAAPSAALAQSQSLQLQVPTTSNFTTNTNTDSTQPSTIQYNASMGQNNNFAVGTNTNFGVQSSAGSTPDYSVSTAAALEAGTGSLLRNQIGSSGAASAADSFTTSASSAASAAMSQKVDAAWDVYVKANTGVDNDDRAAWEVTYKNSGEYTAEYNQAFSSAYSAISGSSSSSNTAGGTISGEFVSVTSGTAGSQVASSGNTVYTRVESASGGWEYRAAGVADFSAPNAVFYAVDASATGGYDQASSSQIANAATAAASSGSSSVTTNSVTVKGIGSDASFQAAASKFEVAIESNLGKLNAGGTADLILTGDDAKVSSSATANGSATGNFGTNSTASSNSSTYTSVFYQAF